MPELLEIELQITEPVELLLKADNEYIVDTRPVAPESHDHEIGNIALFFENQLI